MSRSPAQVMTALLRNSVPLSTLLRRRSNSDYADPWVIPTPPRISLPRKGSGVGQVGITQPLGLRLPSPIAGEGGQDVQSEEQGGCRSRGGAARAVCTAVRFAAGRMWLYTVVQGQPVAGDGSPEQVVARPRPRRRRFDVRE